MSATEFDPPADIADHLQGGLKALEEVVKPRLRGWLHAGAFPCALVMAVVLVLIASGREAGWTSAVFGASAALLFGTSALYHRGRWSPRTRAVLRRLDHACIFVVIGGTYTPFCVLLLASGTAHALLWIVWTGVLLGTVFRVLWAGAPRWLYVPLYVLLGWVAVIYVTQFGRTGGTAVVVLMIAGGVLYSIGAAIYGLRRPDPSPSWFGFHEVFHGLTIVAFLAHYAGVVVVVHSATHLPAS